MGPGQQNGQAGAAKQQEIYRPVKIDPVKHPHLAAWRPNAASILIGAYLQPQVNDESLIVLPDGSRQRLEVREVLVIGDKVTETTKMEVGDLVAVAQTTRLLVDNETVWVAHVGQVMAVMPRAQVEANYQKGREARERADAEGKEKTRGVKLPSEVQGKGSATS